MQAIDLQILQEGSEVNKETWIPVWWCQDYDVSNFGRVRSRKRKLPIILSACPNQWGYLQVALCQNGKVKCCRIHVLVLEAFVCKRPSGKNANHKDGNKNNNFDFNLEWVTHQENVIHSYKTELKHGLRGEKSGRSKLKDGEVWLIKKLWLSGIPSILIGKMFKVTPHHTARIGRDELWGDIDISYDEVSPVKYKTDDYGERHFKSKWKDGEVWLIKKLLNANIDRKIIQKMFNMKKSNLSHIAVGMTWRHIEV